MRAFWKGNGTNVVRIFPYSAVQFSANEHCLRFFASKVNVPDASQCDLACHPSHVTLVPQEVTSKKQCGWCKSLPCRRSYSSRTHDGLIRPVCVYTATGWGAAGGAAAVGGRMRGHVRHAGDSPAGRRAPAPVAAQCWLHRCPPCGSPRHLNIAPILACMAHAHALACACHTSWLPQRSRPGRAEECCFPRTEELGVGVGLRMHTCIHGAGAKCLLLCHALTTRQRG